MPSSTSFTGFYRRTLRRGRLRHYTVAILMKVCHWRWCWTTPHAFGGKDACNCHR